MAVFKGKVIENRAYYQRLHIQTILTFVSTPLLIVAWIIEPPTSLTLIWLIPLLVFLVMGSISFWNWRLIKQWTSKRQLKMTLEFIDVLDDLDVKWKRYLIRDLEQIQVPTHFVNKDDHFPLLPRKPHQNFIVLHDGAKVERFDFEIESSYMKEHMELLVKDWRRLGMIVEEVDAQRLAAAQ